MVIETLRELRDMLVSAKNTTPINQFLGHDAAQLRAGRGLLAERRREARLPALSSFRELGILPLEERHDVVALRAFRDLQGCSAMSINRARVETSLHRQESDHIEMAPITGHVEGRDAVLAPFTIDTSFREKVDNREIPFLASKEKRRRPGLVDRLQGDTSVSK